MHQPVRRPFKHNQERHLHKFTEKRSEFAAATIGAAVAVVIGIFVVTNVVAGIFVVIVTVADGIVIVIVAAAVGIGISSTVCVCMCVRKSSSKG